MRAVDDDDAALTVASTLPLLPLTQPLPRRSYSPPLSLTHSLSLPPPTAPFCPRIMLGGPALGPVQQAALRLGARLRAEHPPDAGGVGGGGGMASGAELLARIEALVLQLVHEVGAGRCPTLLVPTHRWRNRRRAVSGAITDGVAAAGGVGAGERAEMRWTEERARPRMASIMLVLARAARLLRDGCYITRRELFYAHTQLLGEQSAIDEAVLDAAAILGVPPWELRIMPTSKGLIAGPMCLRMASGAVIDCDVPGGALVPMDAHELQGVDTSARFVLVVEKDAAFQRLLQEGAVQRLGPCVLVTGKGYPDTLVRTLLHRLWDIAQIPILLFMDADPHGIEIMATYRWGSKALAHEAARLALPGARWLGLWPSEVAPLGLRSRPLGPRDAGRLRSLAARPDLRAHPPVLSEVELQQRTAVKAEIEDAALRGSTFLTDMYLPRKISALDVI